LTPFSPFSLLFLFFCVSFLLNASTILPGRWHFFAPAPVTGLALPTLPWWTRDGDRINPVALGVAGWPFPV
jgi:hypothetical protein